MMVYNHGFVEKEYLLGNLGHMTKLVSTSIYGKRPSIIFFAIKGPLNMLHGIKPWACDPQ